MKYLLIPFLFISFVVRAENIDFVVTTQNDTLWGEVTKISNKESSMVSMKIDGKLRKFESKEIKIVRYKDKLFMPRNVRFNNKGYWNTELLVLEESGPIMLFITYREPVGGRAIPKAVFREKAYYQQGVNKEYQIQLPGKDVLYVNNTTLEEVVRPFMNECAGFVMNMPEEFKSAQIKKAVYLYNKNCGN